MSEFTKFFTDGKKNPKGEYSTYIIPKTNQDDKVNDLKSWLDKNGIEHAVASASKSIQGFKYLTGKKGQVKVTKGDMVVSAKQAKSVLVQVLFEPQTVLRDSMTYDITAWSIPYVYGLDAYALKGDVKLSTAKNLTSKTKVITGSPYAYILPWKGINDLKFLAYLFKHDIVTRVSIEPFEIGNREYSRGTLVITRKGNEKHGSIFDEIVNRGCLLYTSPSPRD